MCPSATQSAQNGINDTIAVVIDRNESSSISSYNTIRSAQHCLYWNGSHGINDWLLVYATTTRLTNHCLSWPSSKTYNTLLKRICCFCCFCCCCCWCYCMADGSMGMFGVRMMLVAVSSPLLAVLHPMVPHHPHCIVVTTTASTLILMVLIMLLDDVPNTHAIWWWFIIQNQN